MFGETSKWSKTHPIRSETFIQAGAVSKSNDLIRKRVGQNKNPILITACHILKLVGCIYGCIWRQKSLGMSDRMDSRSKCLILIISSRKTQEKYTDDLRSPEWTPGDKTLIMETPRKIIKILSLLAKILSRKFVLLSSILVARRQMRALYSLPEHSARNALISNRYSGL